jgi:hypothetical protein
MGIEDAGAHGDAEQVDQAILDRRSSRLQPLIDPRLVPSLQTEPAKTLRVPGPGQTHVILGTPELLPGCVVGWKVGDQLVDQLVGAFIGGIGHDSI